MEILSSLLGSSLSGRPASFRGAGFFVKTTTDEYGRRGAHHEFPGRDRGLWEDLGGKDPVISISAFVTGFDASSIAAKKNALIKACTAPGAARLVHPWMGAKTVVCTDCKVVHDATALGYIAFELSFLDAATVPACASAAMGVDSVFSLGDVLEGSLIEQFCEDFQLDQVASFVQAAASGDWMGLSIAWAVCWAGWTSDLCLIPAWCRVPWICWEWERTPCGPGSTWRHLSARPCRLFQVAGYRPAPGKP